MQTIIEVPDGDASPSCRVCGTLVVRAGSMWVCLNCGWRGGEPNMVPTCGECGLVDRHRAPVGGCSKWASPELADLRAALAVLGAECRAWREAWDGRDDGPSQIGSDPYHNHDEPGKWDNDGRVCESCQRFAAVEQMRAATAKNPLARAVVEGSGA